MKVVILNSFLEYICKKGQGVNKMIDITKDEFWDSKYEETSRIERKENKVKQFIIRHKIITALLITLSILIATNTILIYNFFRILDTLR